MIARRAVERHDKMVCFDDGADRFQMRAAGIAIRNGRVLVQNLAGVAQVFLPGGRVDQHESSPVTLIREMDEEFSRRVEIGPLAFVIESFFPQHDRVFHEVGFYYPMNVPDDFPYHDTDICHRFTEGTTAMEYRWVEATPSALAACNMKPDLLRARLLSLPASVVHIVDDRANV